MLNLVHKTLFTSLPRFLGKKRFNDRSKGFPFGQQPVKKQHNLNSEKG